MVRATYTTLRERQMAAAVASSASLAIQTITSPAHVADSNLPIATGLPFGEIGVS
jgi:hypothetical protein